MINGIILPENKSTNNLMNLDKFLENEKTNNEAEPWCKLNKTLKSKKLLDYAKIYQTENQLTEEESEAMIHFLKDCLDRKKLQRVKDVLYNKELGVVTGIPALCYIKQTKHFTLKNTDKRISTLKSLAGPKKSQGTIRKKDAVAVAVADSNADEDTDQEEEEQS